MTLAPPDGEPISVDAPAATRRILPGIAIAGAASLGAGAIHAAAAGIHAEHVGLTRLFVLIAVLQIGAGVAALLWPSRGSAGAVLAVNATAVGGWLITRITGISTIAGLESREAPQLSDTLCAALGATAAAAALAALVIGWRDTSTHAGNDRVSHGALGLGLAVAAVTVPAMFMATSHSHDHALGDDHAHGTEVAADGTVIDTHAEGDDHAHADGEGHADDSGIVTDPVTAEVVWPRPYDPAAPIDISDVPGVTPEQEARARQLILDTQRDLPRYSDLQVAIADGYRSIGDSGTGVEHFIRYDLIDDVMLDSSAPESLVYRVDGDERILEGAMFIASARPTDDPSLTGFAGPLMTWHNHGDLCWDIVDGRPTVVGLVDDSGACAHGVNRGGENPMVHVWIVPHECGPFAALEGAGAGQAAVSEAERVDKCQDHGHGSGDSHEHSTVVAKPFDPAMPIDLSGIPGVTPQQQARAENLIAATISDLPKWADYRDAEAAGFRSIGDGLTGHEHFIQWDWINDDVILDPDFPESLVYAPQPDGSKRLVSAMYMLPDTVGLDEVPDVGGPLMQWHIHDNLCFTTGDAPRVAGLTNGDGGCPPGLQKFRPSPMVHVWIVPTECGPFAALEGVGAGQTDVAEDERVDRCQHAHDETKLGL
jgi:hypothetical protein